MQQFYGMLKGRGKTIATRVGVKESGLQTRARTRNGEIEVILFYDKTEKVDKYEIYLKHYHKVGNTKRLIEQGVIED